MGVCSELCEIFKSGVTDVVGWPTVVSILDEALFKAGMVAGSNPAPATNP